MDNASNVDGKRSTLALKDVPLTREYWPMARAADMDLHLARLHRVNLLLMGSDRLIEEALLRLMPDLLAPIHTWTAPDPLELPSAVQAGTLILREVGELGPADQCRLAAWLEASGGRTQVISTTTSRLLRRVDAGSFLDSLYYRLNVVCVEITT